MLSINNVSFSVFIIFNLSFKFFFITIDIFLKCHQIFFLVDWFIQCKNWFLHLFIKLKKFNDILYEVIKFFFHSILSKNHCIFFNKFNLDFIQRNQLHMCHVWYHDEWWRRKNCTIRILINAYYIYIYKGKCPLIIINSAEPLDTKKSSYLCSYHCN